MSIMYVYVCRMLCLRSKICAYLLRKLGSVNYIYNNLNALSHKNPKNRVFERFKGVRPIFGFSKKHLGSAEKLFRSSQNHFGSARNFGDARESVLGVRKIILGVLQNHFRNSQNLFLHCQHTFRRSKKREILSKLTRPVIRAIYPHSERSFFHERKKRLRSQ